MSLLCSTTTAASTQRSCILAQKGVARVADRACDPALTQRRSVQRDRSALTDLYVARSLAYAR